MFLLLAGALGCEKKSDEPLPMATAVRFQSTRLIADVADQVTPSVVSILSERSARHDIWADATDLLGPEAPHRRDYDLGSGVIVSSDGAIVTSSHVVAQAESVRVALKDGRTLDARVIGSDPETDVAVIRVDATDLTPIQVGDSSRLRTGDLVLAIGNPFGVGQTVTMGIVSAVGRSNMGITSYDEFIQTDAAINPGNSGGALVDMDGRLVGMNTAIISRTGGYQGIGFAIPSRMVIPIKDALLEHGKVIRGWLGAELGDLTEELAAAVGVAPRSGVVITEVTPDGPAAGAGLERGDVITAIDGTKATDAGRVRNQIAMTETGTTMRLDVLRKTDPRSLTLVLREQPEKKEAVTEAAEASDEAGLFAGVTVKELDASTRRELAVPDELHGVVVSAIEPGSLASFLGFHVGDLIVAVNREVTPTLEMFHRAIGTEKSAVVLVFRDGTMIMISVSAHGE